MKSLKLFSAGVLGCLLVSCGDMLENIEQYIDKGETIYVGKVDSLKLYPGRERIGLRGDLRYGLTQTRCTISWLHPSGEEQSKSIDIVRTSPDDKFDVVLTDMQEGPYEFTVITYDGLGNKSIPVTANGYVYGDLYEQSLVNRSIEGDIVTSYEDGEFIATIKWLPLNYEEAQETCLTYELADGSGQKSIKVNTGDNRSVITGAKPGGEFEWYTVYKPDSLAIDMFRSDVSSQRSTTQYRIPVVNAGNPFVHDDRGLVIHQRFGYVKGWIANAAAEANGTFDTWGGRNSLSLWTYPNYSPVGTIENGKIYQEIELPAGGYRFDVYMNSFNPNGSPYEIYAAVATGLTEGLPDVAEVHTKAIGSAKCPDDVTDNRLSVSFTLDKPMKVAFGFVGTLGGDADFNVSYVELWSN